MIDRVIRWYQRYDAWKLMAWYLTILILIGAYSFDPVHGLLRFAIALAVGGLDFFLHKLHTPDYKKWPLSGAITARIVLLVLPFDVPLWILITTILLALFSKHLIRWNNRHIFNPAAFGLVVMGLATGTTFGWWGDAVPLLTILLGAAVVYRIKKQVQVLAFLVTYFLLYGLLQIGTIAEGGASLSFLLLSVSWFFALGMVPEPQTSPPSRRDQVIFGALVAVLSIGSSYVSLLANVALPAALLLGNAFAAYQRSRLVPVPSSMT